MCVLLCVLVCSTISGYLGLASAEKWIQANPQGSFAMGFTKGYINNGLYQLKVPDGSDEVKRNIRIESEKVNDTIDMVFNTNTMVFSNWDGWFKLGNEVYTDTPGELYFIRSDNKCNKSKYDKQGEYIKPIQQDLVEESICQTLKAKVDEKMKNFLLFPFKYMLPTPDATLKATKGFPGGEYYTGKDYGNVFVCQFSVEIPSGDSEKAREIIISAPGIQDKITMKINSKTEFFGKWDGSFYIDGKVYTNEPRVLYVEDNQGGCVKKVFKENDVLLDPAYTKVLQAHECFIVRDQVFNDMQKLIADPKLMAAKENPAQPEPKPESKPVTAPDIKSPPITVTSTVVFPRQVQTSPSNTSGSMSQSTHTIILDPRNYQVPMTVPVQPQQQYSLAGTNSNVHMSTVTSNHPEYPSVSATTVTQNQPLQSSSLSQPPTYVINQGYVSNTNPQTITISQSPDQSETYQGSATVLGLQQQQVPDSGINSHVHMSTVTSNHPDYRSVSATTVTQNQPLQSSSLSQPPTYVINRGYMTNMNPQTITISQSPDQSETYQGSTTVLGLQQQHQVTDSGINSHVHMSTVTSNHPDYPSVRTTSVTQSRNPPQIQSSPGSQPMAFVFNQAPPAEISHHTVTFSQVNNAMPNQQLVLSPKENVNFVVPPAANTVTSKFFIQSQNPPVLALQSNLAPQPIQNNALNVHSHNVNIQPDGSLLVDGKSVFLQGIDPNSELITPDGHVVRVGRSVNQVNQQDSSIAYQPVNFDNQGNSAPVLTFTGNSQTSSGNVQTLLTVPSNQVPSQIQHSVTVNTPGNGIPNEENLQEIQPESQNALAINTNLLVKSDEVEKPNTKLYFLQNNNNYENVAPEAASNSPLLYKMVQPISSSQSGLRLTPSNIQTSQYVQSFGSQIQTQPQPNVMYTSHASTIAMTRPVENQSGSDVRFKLEGSGDSMIINAQTSNQQVASFNQAEKNNERGNSGFKLLKSIIFPSPVNNLIVNIADKTNFNKKKK